MNGELFKIIDGGYVILRRKGVYRQAKLYELYRSIFAQYGGGFVRLSARGGTTEPSISWEGMSVAVDTVLTVDKFGAPIVDHEAIEALKQKSPNPYTAGKVIGGLLSFVEVPPRATGVAAVKRVQEILSDYPLPFVKLRPKKVTKAIKRVSGASKRKSANGRVSA